MRDREDDSELKGRHEKLSEEEIDRLAEENQSQVEYQQMRQILLERNGYSNEDEFEEAYWAGEADSELGEPAIRLDLEEENIENDPYTKKDDYRSKKYDSKDYDDSSDDHDKSSSSDNYDEVISSDDSSDDYDEPSSSDDSSDDYGGGYDEPYDDYGESY
jgi:hypothetical protein